MFSSHNIFFVCFAYSFSCSFRHPCLWFWLMRKNKKGVKPSFLNPHFLIRRLVKALDQIRDEHFTPSVNLSYLILGRQDYQSSIKENKHFKLYCFLILSTVYVISILLFSRCKDTCYYSNSQCFYGFLCGNTLYDAVIVTDNDVLPSHSFLFKHSSLSKVKSLLQLLAEFHNIFICHLASFSKCKDTQLILYNKIILSYHSFLLLLQSQNYKICTNILR